MEEKYTVAEGFDLPSKGLIYDKNMNSHIELRSMTTREEMKRMSPSNTPYKTLADIIEACMIEKPAVHVYDMCLGDYEYLLHKLRVVTYGPTYSMSVGCPNCGSYVDVKISLDDLEVQPFDIGGYEELRSLTLPVSNKIVTLNFQTPRTLDEIEIRAKELNKKFKNTNVDYRIFVTLTEAIDTVDGNKLTQLELEDFVNSLPARDSNKIINTIMKLNKMIGLDTDIEVTCPKCGGDILTFFRFGPEFFRPSDDE